MSTLSPQIQNFISTCSPEEIDALLHAINVNQNKALDRQNRMSPQPKAEVSMRSSPPSKTAGVSKRSPRSSKSSPERAAKRPLNSFMAFRSYYSSIFVNQQQKDISGFLTLLWQADIQKAKFSLLAKAYSIIRDLKGKDQAPLDIFLKLACPRLNVTKPDRYLSTFGWRICTPQDNGRPALERSPGTADLDVTFGTTTSSVSDLLEFCTKVGYITDREAIAANLCLEKTGSPTLTMASRPSKQRLARAEKAKAQQASYVLTPASPSTSPAGQVDRPRCLPTLMPSSHSYYTNTSQELFPTDTKSQHMANEPGQMYSSLDLDQSNNFRQTLLPTGTALGASSTIDPQLFSTQQHMPTSSATDSELALPPLGLINLSEPTTAFATADDGVHTFEQQQQSADHDEYIFEPFGTDRFFAYNISSFDDVATTEPGFWQI